MTEFKNLKCYKRLIDKQLLRSVRYTVLELFPETFHANLWSSVWRRHVGAPPRDTNMAAANQ